MPVNPKLPARDSLYRLAQIGATLGVQLVRMTALSHDNVYAARPVEFDDDGDTKFVGNETFSVTNLAEPSDADGVIPAGTDAVAIDVEGRWIVFVRPPATGAAAFPAKVIGSTGGCGYTVREQVCTGFGQFADRQGAADLAAWNLAEMSLGPGAAIDDGTIVLVTTLTDSGSPPTLRYVFDHPAYAKYLD